MERQRVQSESIRSAGYDSVDGVLELEFHTGGVYRYHDVPAYVFTELLNARSKGRYFREHILERFSFTKLEQAADFRVSGEVRIP